MKMELLLNNLLRQRSNTIFVVILFYVVGVVGIAIPGSQPFFRALIPFALLLSFILIMLFHKSWKRLDNLFAFPLIYLLGYLVEVLGVKTHLIFGHYTYGEGLGFKLFDTPLMIGINWVMVVYCSAAMLAWTRWPSVIQILVASGLLVLYDLVLEHVAPLLGMWSWQENHIPLQNYLAWFVLAAGFHGLLKWMKVRTINPVASAILICQFLFFIAILIFVKK